MTQTISGAQPDPVQASLAKADEILTAQQALSGAVEDMQKTIKEAKKAGIISGDEVTRITAVYDKSIMNLQQVADSGQAIKTELGKTAMVAIAAKPATTPPKTAIRYINDTLFVSNFGSMLVSLLAMSNMQNDASTTGKHYPSIWIFVYALFFVLFRIKCYLDDNLSLIEKETEGDTKNPGKGDKNYFIIASLSWILYSISGLAVFTHPELSLVFFGSSLIVFLLWILCHRKKASATSSADGSKPRKQDRYALFNFLYVLVFAAMFVLLKYPDILGWCEANDSTPYLVGCVMVLIGILVCDCMQNDSLGKIYR